MSLPFPQACCSERECEPKNARQPSARWQKEGNMFHPVKMAKVRAVCLKAAAPSVIRELHNLSVLHIVDAALPGISRSEPLSSYDEISPRLLRIRAMREALGKTGKLPKRKLEIEKPLAMADELLADYDNLLSLIKHRDEVSRELDANSSAQKSLAELSGLKADFSRLESPVLQFVLLRAGEQKAKAAAAWLEKKKNCAFSVSHSHVFLVALLKGEDVKQLEKFGPFSPIPQIKGTPLQAKSELEGVAAKLSEKLLAAQKRLENFTNMHYPRLAAVEEALQIEADRAEIATQFGASSALYYIEGWVEDAKFEWLSAQMKEKFGKKALLTKAPLAHHDLPPTKLSNPKMAGPFQFVVDFLSTTGYSEIDPTMLLAFFIPIIYALIFGDAGYAIMSFLFASLMLKKSKEGSLLNQIAKIWRLAAIPAFLLGIVFDEYFGFTHTHLLEELGFGHIVLYEGMHRVESITTLMLICIIVGMVHLGVGFILGAINEWHHSRKHAVAKLCWLGIEISGFFLVAAGMFGAFPALMVPSAALFALCVIGLVLTEGPIAAVEIPGLASNIMSYIRIAAVGVGGVILAEAINDLLLPKFDATPAGIAAFLLTFAIYMAVHAVSCLIAMFESFIHGARLNVVEFFGKFYKGNGVKFLPFSAQRMYTQESG